MSKPSGKRAPADASEANEASCVSATSPRRIVLTGASRGLGLAMAAGFIELGHVVCGCARSAAALVPLRQRWPAPHRFDAVDVADDDQVRQWALAVLADGVPDLLINNAALDQRQCSIVGIAGRRV